MKIVFSCLVYTLCLISFVSCSRSPTAPDPPALDAGQAADSAIQLYDVDQSGVLEQNELTCCPSLVYALGRIDKNQDEMISQAELQARISHLLNSGTTLIEPIALVLQDGKPLPHARITFEPEPFLGNVYQQAQGKTDNQGMAVITGHDSKLPGIYLGFYRVRISRIVNGQESISEDYNKNSTLGIEAAADAATLMQFSVSKELNAT